jgi:hypothetical protein
MYYTCCAGIGQFITRTETSVPEGQPHVLHLGHIQLDETTLRPDQRPLLKTMAQHWLDDRALMQRDLEKTRQCLRETRTLAYRDGIWALLATVAIF